jgi:hypothetical protein
MHNLRVCTRCIAITTAIAAATRQRPGAWPPDARPGPRCDLHMQGTPPAPPIPAVLPPHVQHHWAHYCMLPCPTTVTGPSRQVCPCLALITATWLLWYGACTHHTAPLPSRCVALLWPTHPLPERMHTHMVSCSTRT